MGTVYAREQQPSNLPYLKPKENENENEILLDEIKARVDKVHVDGLSRTKDDIVQDCLKDLFKARNLEEVLVKAHQARLKLDELYCFKNIGVFIDTSKGAAATPDGLEVTFNVKEHNRLIGGVNTHIGNNEGNLMLGIRAPNIFGRGERVQVEYSYGSKHTTNFNVAFIKPLRSSYRPILTSSIFQSHSEWPVSGYKELDRGVLLDFAFHTSSLVKHNLQWEGIIREVSALSRSTSFEVREYSGFNLKSALKYIISMDQRDDHIFPSVGSLLKASCEIAGLGGDIGFLKNEVYLQTNYSLIDNIVLQGCLMAGFINSINNDMKIGLSDRCYIGGPQSLRGFNLRGVGPHAEGDALGASAFWASGLHLFTPLPFNPGKGGFGDLFKMHMFLTAGNVGDFDVMDDHFYEKITKNMRISYGLGVAIRLGGMARVEVNYCFPHIYEKGDRIHPGIQFGVGVQFL